MLFFYSCGYLNVHDQNGRILLRTGWERAQHTMLKPSKAQCYSTVNSDTNRQTPKEQKLPDVTIAYKAQNPINDPCSNPQILVPRGFQPQYIPSSSLKMVNDVTFSKMCQADEKILDVSSCNLNSTQAFHHYSRTFHERIQDCVTS